MKKFKLVHLPLKFSSSGHTPGHIGFIEHEKILLLLAMFFSKTVLVGRLPRGDFDTLIPSIKNKLFTLNDDMVVSCRTWPISTIGQENEAIRFEVKI